MSKTERSRKEGETLLWTLGAKKNEDEVRDIVEVVASRVRMDCLVTFVYHHMGALKKGVDDLGYPRCNEVYWLEPGLDLGKGFRVLTTDAEVMRMCESAMKNDNTVHLYFDHPIDANPEIIDEKVVSDGNSDSVVEVNSSGDNVNEVEVTNKVDGQANEKENECVNETRNGRSLDYHAIMGLQQSRERMRSLKTMSITSSPLRHIIGLTCFTLAAYREYHEGLPCLPPPYKRPIGRPIKKRRKDSTEQSSCSQYKAKRRYEQITCQTCKRAGHNDRICPEKGIGTAAEEPYLDEEEAREQKANWEKTTETTHTAHG
ncbi:hypothetical protein Ahy_B03g062625 [Arachis hypogaea]|uniref:PB1-like domain-containing protein n=1 Tax=Arachis hypogaea TaxID=3818 RepID=A0A444ZUX7_ARAHY|nr:hypothetical protein Ahy_B03g062625 [Arachis hypogaea]